MFRGGFINLAVAALLLTACSSSWSTSTEATTAPTITSEAPASTAAPSPSPSLLSLADACVGIQDALDDVFADNPSPEAGDYRTFSEAISDLSAETDPKGRNMLEQLADVSKAASTNLAQAMDLEALATAKDPWFNEMDRVSEVCSQQGAPLK
jgi:hypothetical protein